MQLHRRLIPLRFRKGLLNVPSQIQQEAEYTRHDSTHTLFPKIFREHIDYRYAPVYDVSKKHIVFRYARVNVPR